MKALPEMEEEVLGIQHTEAGALVTAKFGLDRQLEELIKHHHDEPLGSESDLTLAVVRVADGLANQLGVGYQPEAAPPAAIHEADLSSALHLTKANWPEAECEMKSAVDAALVSLAELE